MRFTVWKNAKFSLTEKVFREISSLVTSLVITLLSRNFCQKCVRVNFRNFHSMRFRPIFKMCLGGRILFTFLSATAFYLKFLKNALASQTHFGFTNMRSKIQVFKVTNNKLPLVLVTAASLRNCSTWTLCCSKSRACFSEANISSFDSENSTTFF